MEKMIDCIKFEFDHDLDFYYDCLVEKYGNFRGTYTGF